MRVSPHKNLRESHHAQTFRPQQKTTHDLPYVRYRTCIRAVHTLQVEDQRLFWNITAAEEDRLVWSGYLGGPYAVTYPEVSMIVGCFQILLGVLILFRAFKARKLKYLECTRCYSCSYVTLACSGFVRNVGGGGPPCLCPSALW